ncbi:Cyclin-dependent kinase-like 2 [Larimichthys crocea]|uniref:mitogen-activated protein kinase n=1 Tax=Larimichthys crocea TaxID=215358 RepID=A0A6G0HK67_LARCR|nr:Cyclin-dependent kinase-like 2 [Larimichthys crocea]
MERYESLGLVGEGSYGTVLKCRHRDSGRLVAIKKFMDSDDDKTVKKIALREIKLLRVPVNQSIGQSINEPPSMKESQLRHDNLVNLIEVWKRRRRWYLVFEFVERTLLDDLEQNPNGLELNTSRQFLYQILRAAAFCHQQNVIHRDIKPENILISQGGVVKLCDFGFARTMTSPAEGGIYTDYVATRWYRAPELLVGDTKYGKPVDVWAVGCLLIEMLTGQPLFPGDSDLDQIYHIVRCFGNLTAHHQELFYRNPVFSGVRLPECSSRVPLEQRLNTVTTTALDLAQSCLQMDPERRAQCSDLLEHLLFTQDSFHIRVLDELNAKIQKDHRENSTLPKIAKTPRREKDEGDDKTRRGKDKDKKQSENMDEKVNKEKEKEGGEEKISKTKGKQPSKLPKSILNKSEPLMSTKQSKTLDAKIVDNAAKPSVAMRSKAAKATGAELRKEPEISKPTKSLTSDSLEAPTTATDLKDNVNELEFSSLYSSPPPPPPPPSSTPLLLPPSSTSVIPSISVISNNSPVTSDHFTLAAGFHPGTHSLRCVDKPRHHGGVYNRQSLSSHITGPLAAQVSDKSLICERSFLSDRYNHGNSGGVTVKKKSDIHFPDLRSSVLPELRGRESKHNKGTTKNQQKDKQPVLSITPTEPQQPGYNRTDSYSP